MSTCVSILRIGPFPDDNDCAVQLKTALLRHFAKNKEQEEQTAPDSSASTTSKKSAEVNNPITLSNKYFTAKVLLEEIGSTQHAAAAAASNTAPHQSCLFAEDGLVLVFDAFLSNPNSATTMSASFDAMETIHDRAVVGSDTGQPAGDLLRLCVGVVRSRSGEMSLSTKEYEQEYSRRVLWCLDRGYEYVEADLSEEGLTVGHEDRDKEGFARIVEAVSGTVWSSAVMEKRKQAELKESYAKDTVAAATATENQENLRTYEPPDPTKLPPVVGIEEDEERERKARESLLAADDDDADGANNVKDDSQGPTTNNNDNDTEVIAKRNEEREQERVMNALEGSLREASRLREMSKSGQLSDDERRKRAGDAAMLLMDMMGQMGLSDDEEGDESLTDLETEGEDEQ